MTDSLQILLHNLHNAIKHPSNSKGVEASHCVKDIVSICQDLAMAPDIEYSSLLLFSEDFGVLEFIRATINLKEFENPKADLLAFLESYLEVIGDYIPQYAKETKDLCLMVLNRDASSKVKIEGFNLLMKLLKSKNRNIHEKLDVFSLAERLFSLCLQSSKQSSSGVRGAIFNTLGVIAERFPEYLTGKADRLSSIYLGTLKEQMVTVKKPDFLVISGCLRGLTCYLVSFSKPLEGCSKYAAELFGYIKKLIDPKIYFARYETPKAALNLIKRHSFYFRKLITDDYEYIYDSLSQWSKHTNKEIRISGVLALDSCLDQISRYIVDIGKNMYTMRILKSFVKHFHSVLTSESASIKEISMAIKGFGIFAEACKKLLDEKDLKLIFEEILNRSQYMFSSMEDLKEDALHNFSAFLESFSNILQQLSGISSVYLVPIERMIILLFENYPKLGKGGMFVYEKGLARFIRVLAQNANVFKACLSQIVYQGLIRTCSHSLITEEGLSSEDDSSNNEPQISYQSYIDLWCALLTEKNYKDQNLLDDSTVPKIMVNHVYDELIQSIIVIAKKLDLKALNSFYMDPEARILGEPIERVAVPTVGDVSSVGAGKDIEIFINLVEFCREILLKCDSAHFYRWIPIYVREIIVLSSRFPFVSGFYKLMEVNARICVKLKYFKCSRKEVSIINEDEATYSLLSKFVKDVLGRTKQFKYDLLSSCLQFLLHLPVQFVEENVANFAKPVETALKLGLSYDSLAVAALDALEQWNDHISSDKMKPLLLRILPYFDGYLQTGSEKSGSDDGNEEISTISQSAQKRRNRVPIRLLKALRDSSKTATSPLMQLRYRIVNFLGNLGGSINIGLVKGGRIPDVSHAVAWSTSQHLSLALPFSDMKPTVYLDPFLPRAIKLATTSSDRQTKVVSCELLHAITLFVLGKSAQQTNQSTKQEGMNEIYSRLFPAVLRLACDIELVAEQLFRPLAFQMIHWFTSSPSKTESADTMILLDTILEGLVNHNNHALREFSAVCIREFLEWSIKQSSSKQLSKSAINPKAVFKRIYSMAKHPNAYKRLGAASAFNSLYKVFREHDDLVDIYVLELLAFFIESLSMAHDDEPVIGTIERSKKAIDHIGKIVKGKSALLFKRNNYRRVPPVLQTVQSSDLTIDHMFVWLLRQCGSPTTECRHKCMELLFDLLPTQPGVSHARIWFDNTLKSDGADFFVERFEGYGFTSSEVKLSPIIARHGSNLRVNDLVYWYEGYLAALDCYNWISSAQLIKLEKLFASSSSVMLECVGIFIKELVAHDVEQMMVHLLRSGINIDSHNITPMDKEKYNRTKCTAIVRTLDFLSSTLASGMWRNDNFSDQTAGIFSDNFYMLICRCLFHPESVGFNIADIEVLQNLPEQLQVLLLAMKKGLPLSIFTSFIGYMTSFLSKQRYDLAARLPIDLRSSTLQSSQQCLEVQQLISGYDVLNRVDILKDCKTSQDIRRLCSDLFSNILDGLLPFVYDSDVTIVPSQKNLAESLLILALHLQRKNQTLIEILLDQKPIETVQGKGKISSRGIVFYQFFKSAINGHISKIDGSIISELIKNKSSNPLQFAIILQDLIEFAGKKTHGIDNFGKTRRDALLKTVVKEWVYFRPLWKEEAPIETKIVVFNILRGLLAINAKDTLESYGLNTSPFDTYLQLISETETGLRFKTQMFEVLPILLDGLEEDKRILLKMALKQFIAKAFPISSADLMVGTTRHSEYTNCLHKLFKCLSVSSSHVLLDVLLTVIVKETDDVYEKVILPSLKLLSKSFKQSSTEAQLSLDLCFKIVLDEENHSSCHRKSVTNRVLMILLRAHECSVVKQFYVDNIKTIVQKCEAKLPKQFESLFEAHLITKICCFKLIQTLYVIFAKEELTMKHSTIVKSAFPSSETGKELTQAITKAAQSAKSEDCRGETILIDLRREYHCSAYNALIAVIACTQTEQKFYTGFLFTENKIKGQMLWDNIIHVDEKFTFDAEQTVPFARKVQLQMIRKTYSSTHEEDEFEKKGYVPYLSSQYLMDSSLSEDVSKFDFSTPVQAYSTATSAQFLRSKLSRETKKPSEDDEVDVSHLPEDVLEMDEVNKNESMSALVSLLKHMKDSNVYDHPDEGRQGSNMPAWMNCVFKKFSTSDTALNVKIFLLKLIVNVPQIFEPYGKFWFQAIVQLIISEQLPGDRLSYFIVDAIVVMLSWSNTCIPEDTVVGRNLASSLLDYLIRNCHHNNRAVLKNNLQVIRTLTKVWKDLLEINYKLIYENFNHDDHNTKDNMTGIQILGLILTSGFQPYCSKSGVHEEKYYSALIQNLAFKYKDVYASAAEVLGLAMKVITDNFETVDCPLFMQAYEKLVELSTTNDEKFVICLYGIQLKYPIIVDKFVTKLLYTLPSIHGILKQRCLETLASRADSFDEPQNIFVELKGMGLDASINHRDEGVQLAAITLFNGLMKYLTADEILPLLQSIATLRNQSSVALRNKMYEIFMWIFDTYSRLDEQTLESGPSIEILKLSKEILLLGINDKSTSVSLKVLNFWRHETRLPNSTIERFIEILRALYSTKTEKEYLSYFTNLLLQLTSSSPDYSMPLFNEPLDSSKRFEEYNVNFSWQRQKIAMTPLFAATQIQSQVSSQGNSLSTGMLQATQHVLQFTPTQQETANWMNPTFQIVPEASLLSQAAPSQTFLLSSMELEHKRGFNVGMIRRTKEADAQSWNDKPDEKYNIMKLKKRIWKSKEKTKSYFAMKEQRSQKLRQVATQKQKAARDHKIVMYRKYRKGELPDIQIKHSELIVPLQAAAQCDPIIARELFKMLFDALINELPVKFSEDIMEKVHSDIQEAINGMMNDSVFFHPPFVYALEDACYRNKNLKLDANIVTVASKTGVQHPVGIILLENQLLENDSMEPLQKRKRAEKDHSNEFLTWIELAKLYKSIDKYDFVHTIFSSRITKQESTRLALECEERNDYANALKYYNELALTTDWHGKEPSQEEEEFWDIARLMCYDNLAKWSNLKTLTLQSIDDDSPSDISKIWDDINLQEQFLPYYVRSNLKLMCHGTNGSDGEQFGAFIDDCLKIEERKDILESKFCDDLAFMRILQGNYGGAKHYINMGIQGFCEEWSNLSVLMKESRLNAVSRLQKLYEMKEFTDLVSRNENVSVTAIKDILRIWSERTLDANFHSIAVWDDVMINRCTYLKKMRQKFLDIDGSEEIMGVLDFERAKYLLTIADVGRKQGNFAISLKYLRESYDSTTKDHAKTNGFSVKWHHIYALVNLEKAKKSSLPLSDAVSSLFTVLERLHDIDSLANIQPSWSIQHRLHQIATLDCLAEIISNSDTIDIKSLVDTTQQNVLQMMFGALPTMRKDYFLDYIDECSYRSLVSALSSSHQLDTDVSDNRMLIEKTLMNMVTFCDRRLKQHEEDGMRLTRESEYADNVVRYMLKALTFNSKDARLRFPRLLQIIDRYPETSCQFSKKVDEVPTWMFLAWLNQIVALLDKTEGVFSVLSNIARDYPQALIYPLRISRDQFSFENSPEGKRREDELKRLLGITHNPLCNEFIEALEQLSDPNHVFEDWSKNMLKLLQVKRRNVDDIKQSFEYIWNRLFQSVERKERIKGDVQKKCSKELSKFVIDRFGRYGSNIVDMLVKDFNNVVSEMTTKLKKIGNCKYNLKDYSPWFAAIQGIQREKFIEVPGQYTGQQKPLPEYHARIAGFDERVLVLRSLRRPKKIKIRGHDEKEYAFLVKGGEDLRLDQRIEQLFEIMNGILAKDPTCSTKALTLKTYQVIPLTTRVGIIEWVGNSIPLKELIASAYSDKERDFLKQGRTPADKYEEYIRSYSNLEEYEFIPKLYINLFKKASRTEVLTSFKGIQAMIPWDLLRRALYRLSASTEAYFVLRNHLIQTHSCLCICHYILGIGDRHPDNLMVSKTTGGMIGIDFGYSFGISTTMLPVPELMPFRLTGQFRNLLLPLTDLGPYRIPMTDVLRALRNDSDLLLNTMDIFVHEPLIDWQVNAQKQANQLDVTDKSAEWYPKEKISICKKKLKGLNCAYITGEELRLRSHQKALRDLETVAFGNPQHNIRRRHLDAARDRGCLSGYVLQPEDQVSCLIDQATDFNILGRTFKGWEPFL